MEEQLKVKQAIKREFPVIEREENLEAAIKLMAEADVSVLVTKAEGILVGILTVSDIMQGLANNYDLKDTKISSFMTECNVEGRSVNGKPCVQLDEDLDVMSAIKVMYEGGINHLLVTGANNKPLGVVSNLDLIKLIASR